MGAVMGARGMAWAVSRVERGRICPLTLNAGQCNVCMKAACPGSFYSSGERRKGNLAVWYT